MTIVDVRGKAVIVTDAPALFVAGTPDKEKVLSLVNGAAVVSDGSDLTEETVGSITTKYAGPAYSGQKRFGVIDALMRGVTGGAGVVKLVRA